VRAALPRAARPAGDPVTSADLAGLPVPARRYLRFVGAVGRPHDRSLRARFVGRFRFRPDGPWLRCEAWQFTTAEPAARLFRMRLHRPGLPPMTGWDTYRDGRGGLRATVLGVLPVAQAAGPRFDVAEQVTRLGDALLLAPPMLLRSAVGWDEGSDPDQFRISFTDAGCTVDAEVLVAPTGRCAKAAPTTGGRSCPEGACGPGGARPSTAGGPSGAPADHRGPRRLGPAGRPFPYAELTPTDVAFDVGPGGEPWTRARLTEGQR
jgi:hypothetical protein